MADDFDTLNNVPPRQVDLLSQDVDPRVPPEETEDEPDEKETKEEDAKKTHRQALARFKLVSTVEAGQRKRELEDLKFDRALPEDQWPDSILKARGGTIGPDGQVTGDKPCLTIPKLDQPIQQVLSEARSARIAITVKPKADATREDAEMIQGLVRAIELDSPAWPARMWALDRAVKCGRGWYRILKQYVRQSEVDAGSAAAYDQELVVADIDNQHSVYADPFATRPDKLDMRWALVTSDLPFDEYQDRYGDSGSELASYDDAKLASLGDSLPDWFPTNGNDDEGRSVRIAEYWRVEDQRRTLVHIKGVGAKWKDEMEKDAPGVYDHAKAQGDIETERPVTVRKVTYCVINGIEVIPGTEEEWEGSYIPLIPTIGKRYNVEGKRAWKGVPSNAKDAQRSYNVMRSAQVEAVGMAPKARLFMAEGQDEGYEDQFDNMNTRTYSRLIYKPTTFEGQLVRGPYFESFEAPIQAIGVAVFEADQDIKATTGRQDPSLGRVTGSRPPSQKTVKAMQQQGEQSTSVYLDNLANISMPAEARIMLDLIPHVYDRPGRIERILGEEDKESLVMLNHPFVGGQDGRPVPVSPDGRPMQLPGVNAGQPPQQPGMMARACQAIRGAMGGQKPPEAPKPRHFNLKKGTFNVVVTVGRSFANQRDETNSALSALAQAAPQLVPAFADLWVRSLDGKGMKQIADRLEKMNPAAKNEKSQDGQTIPPAAQAQLSALTDQNQKLTAALKQATQQLQTDAIEAQREVYVKKLELASRERIELIKAKTTLLTTEASLKANAAIDVLDMEIRKIELLMNQSHERHTQQLEHAHEIGMMAAQAAAEPAAEPGAEAQPS